MRRGARNYNGQLSLPGVGKLPAKIARGKGRRRRGGNAETALQGAIRDFAALRPREIRLVRVQCGAARGLGGGWMQLAPEGTADLLGWAFGPGKFVAVEVKLPGEDLKPEQREFLRDVVAAGGWAFVARDVEEFARDWAEAMAGRYAAPGELA